MFKRDSLLRHISSHANPSHREASATRPPESGTGQPPLLDHDPLSVMQSESTPDQMAHVRPFGSAQIYSPKDIYFNKRIHVPPELRGDHGSLQLQAIPLNFNGAAYNIDPTTALFDPFKQEFIPSPRASCTDDNLKANTYGQLMDQLQAMSDHRGEALELPQELYSSAVDAHARQWLKDFCAEG